MGPVWGLFGGCLGAHWGLLGLLGFEGCLLERASHIESTTIIPRVLVSNVMQDFYHQQYQPCDCALAVAAAWFENPS